MHIWNTLQLISHFFSPCVSAFVIVGPVLSGGPFRQTPYVILRQLN